ncbi:hypothetical protein HF086_006020, partial [Spodoptera exigua]
MLRVPACGAQYCCGGGGGGGAGPGSPQSLGALQPHVRRHWLMALLVVLYKFPYVMLQYHYGSGSTVGLVSALVRVVLSSVEAQYHACKRIPHARHAQRRQGQ